MLSREAFRSCRLFTRPPKGSSSLHPPLPKGARREKTEARHVISEAALGDYKGGERRFYKHREDNPSGVRRRREGPGDCSGGKSKGEGRQAGWAEGVGRWVGIFLGP